MLRNLCRVDGLQMTESNGLEVLSIGFLASTMTDAKDAGHCGCALLLVLTNVMLLERVSQSARAQNASCLLAMLLLATRIVSIAKR